MSRLTRIAAIALRTKSFSSVVCAPRIAYVARFPRPVISFTARGMGTSNDEEV